MTKEELHAEMLRMEKINNRNEELLPIMNLLLEHKLISNHLDILDESKTGKPAVMEIARKPLPQGLTDSNPELADLPTTFRIELDAQSIVDDIYKGWRLVLDKLEVKAAQDKIDLNQAIENYRVAVNSELDQKKVETN